MRRSRGFTAIEISAVVAIIGLIALCAIPSFAAYRRRAAMISESTELRSIFRVARSHAVISGRHCGLKFIQAGNQWLYSLYEDGDGDGISNNDIVSGVDRRISGPVMIPRFDIVTIALLPGSARDPDGAVLLPSSPAVKFGNSTICSFGPTGSATPGTVYISDGKQLYAVRVTGPTGRIRLLRYDAAHQRWTS